MRIFLVFVISTVFAACSVGPDYTRPATELPEELSFQDTVVVLDSSDIAASDTSWWDLYGDTVLTRLIRTALHENNDVRIAAARVEEFMGYYGVAKSDFFPKINAELGGSRGQRGFPGDPSAERPTINYFNVNVSATWEIDLWGKIRRANEAAEANLLAAEETRRGIVLTIVSLVAESYIDLLALDKQLDIAKRTVTSRELSLDLFRQRFEKGDVSELELNQIESQYWLARSQIPLFEKNIAQLEHAISVLIGRMPGRIQRGGTLDSLDVPVIPEGIPSEILEQRPDVRTAEEQLISANARIGVAKALYFPSISLTGLFGVASGDLGNLFNSTSQIWNVGGGILQPIFRWGEISGQVDAAEAVQRQMLYGYVQTVQNAFRDAEDALVERSRTLEQRDAQGKQVDALRGYERLARMRYREGVTSYLEVLDAERSLFSTELEYTLTQAGYHKSAVGIYRAFAGAWVDYVAVQSYPPDEPVEPRMNEPEDSPAGEEQQDSSDAE
jgi:multidrug efflux system outer membrane protein